MLKQKRTYLDLLEESLKQLWRKHNRVPVVKAMHTEVIVEPQPFVRGILNPQVADFLVGLYLHNVKANIIKDGKVEVKDGLLRILDGNNNLIAETVSPKIISEYLS
ncbi:hypothetical protein A2276_00560 [candidate division WOR-1 bacterium RIFOXYA12_FULL_43_27]|uniref:Uncharacterized protein n=1 Tax=candidate division WOR-1 bacterium RIFOXYC2_FULL_46_14 TaxID=1802587 RepID=A0A1F4U4M9_UNCSA|nr:MAG: hypothetical protein A2276_00560 [candidate division WOR-1 bacterium RIFOXYA12_FULL_43_27]OGC20817.1 MAG: hypothetical protein A2292_07315 [candidate division WOR-1 bacterium RIFOXYB2_FULL_46_45]OGC31446.1 MAG: hypothetical protein A2232_04135 [candidate division WOR-1 bacterium RIFOXYA2_FULL_46_56]OGC39851.1 MAG: hypothetical protein A2438_04970 [candidate division WOR-1 bacterium RIFOXYC2_FULL_46_14]